MPTLPSGRTVAISVMPLIELAERAKLGKNASFLLFLEKNHQVHSMVRVLEIESARGIPESELDPVDAPGGVRYLMTRDTGYTAADVMEGRTSWPPDDVKAFAGFMATDRIREHIFQHHYETILLREQLTSEVWHSPRATRSQLPQPAPED